MQVVEFTNEFQIKIDFGRFKDYQTNVVKSVCRVIEWTTSIFDGKYITHPTEIGTFLVPKDKWDAINKPFEFTKDNSSITFRNYVSVAKFNWEKKAYIIPTHFLKEVYTLGKICRATHIKIGEQLPEEVDVITPLPELDFHIPLLMGEMRDYQKKGVARGLQLKKYINGDMPGLGKSNLLTDQIQTPDGQIMMGDIFVGQKIFSKNGEIQEVTGVFPQGVIPTYKVTFNDESVSNCSLEHIWSVRDANRKRRGTGWINKTLGEILESGITLKVNQKREASGRQPELKWEIPMCDPVQFSEKEYIIPPYTMGVLLGDGSINGTGIVLNLPDEKIGMIGKVICELSLQMEITRRDDYDLRRFHLVGSVGRNNNPYVRELKRLKLNTLSKSKFIANEYLQGSVNQRKDILAGLMDSDGSCIKNRTIFHTISLKLAESVKYLVESLGGIAKIHPYDRRHEDKGIEYQVNIVTNFNPFIAVEYKKSAWKFNKVFKVSRYIKSVEYIGDFEQQCISVSSPDKLYLTNNFIVTHNTLQSIATLEAAAIKGEDVFPALIICPSALKINWLREFEQWTGRKAIVLNDKIKTSWHVYYEIGEADVFITNPESLKKYFVRKYPNKADLKTSADIEMDPRIDRFKSVIIDEIHKLKNTDSQRSKIALRITRGKKYIIGLTGTPVVNKPSDLIAQLAIISKLKRFGGLNGFKARYCEGGSGASNLKELNFLLNKNCFFRREKHEVLKDLPAKMRQTIFCSLDAEIQKEYSTAENNFKSFLQQNDFTDKEIAKKLRSEVIVKITMLLQLSAKGKIEAAKEYIDEVTESGQKIVVFCRHKIVVDLLCEAYPQAVRVTGSENEVQKQNSVDSFQKNEKTNIIIGSHRAAGVGLTLTASSEVLFLELPWTFADLEQCEDRCHRMGQPESVRCTSLLGENTIDNWLYELIMEKKKIADAVTGADDIVPVSVVDSIMNVFKK